MRDAEAIADVVVTTMQAALAPVLARLAVAEAQLGALADVRDRLMVVETKAAMPVPAVDVAPLTQRQDALDIALAGHLALAPALEKDLRELAAEFRAVHERLAVVETKAAMPMMSLDAPPPAFNQEAFKAAFKTELVERLNSQWHEVVADMRKIRDRVLVVETKAATPIQLPTMPPPVDLAPLETKMATELQALHERLGRVSERLAVAEMRAPIPGPAGPAGTDGAPGKDGRDGIALDDLSVTQDDERTLTFRARVGTETKALGTMTVPVEIYRGVWVDGRTYDGGDGVTWGGSEWHCHTTTTTKPGEGSKAWTLKVKRGRDGKDGRDAPNLPVVRMGA